MRSKVLILTHSADRFVIDRVAEGLARRGRQAFRLDTDLFPGEVRLSAALGGPPRHGISGPAGELDLADVSAVWNRRIWPARLDAGLDPKLRDGAARESDAALRGFLDGLHGARWIDPPDAVRAAENKLRQLRLAEEAGLLVPRTLVSNDPAAVRAFRAEHGDIVAKMLTPLSVGMEHQDFFVRTSLVRDEDLEHLDSLRHAPMVFQELVPKSIELRVACVGRRAFAGAIDATQSARGRVDWRLAKPGEVSWAHAEVPAEVAGRLVDLLTALGLRQGAVDLVRTPDGRHVFLEVNPVGEWGMLERDLGLPIADALAEELAGDSGSGRSEAT
jgi:glutathione synthase/RimK-type ligase-like ATP-grasp enzyme